MARKKYRFRPDPDGTDIWNKLYITKDQRKNILKWALYGLVCVITLIAQDAFFGSFRIFGGYVDLAPCAILLICVMEGTERGSVFALVSSMIYVFSGSAPSTFSIAFLSVYGVMLTLFREKLLRRSFPSAWLCAGLALALYELSVYLVGLFLGLTYPGRITVFAMNAVVTTLSVPLLYPLLGWISKIGGETWKE